jgi:cell division protein FtsN
VQPPPQPRPQPQPQQPQPPSEVREDVLSVLFASDAPCLKTYNIIIGSFSGQENAKNFANLHNSFVAVNDKGMYRVIIASFDDYNAAKNELNNIVKYKINDAWLLAKKR